MFRKYGWILLVMIPVGMVAGLILARVYLHLVPRVYESEIIVQLKPSFVGIWESETDVQYRSGTALGLFKSRAILLSVSERLGLEESWGVDEETILARLKDAVQLIQIRGTDLKSIKVTSTDPVEARDIARELVKTYVEWRGEEEKKSILKAKCELAAAIQKQEEEVEQYRKTLQTLIENNPSDTSNNVSEIVEARRDFDQNSDILNLMKSKIPIGSVEPDISKILVHKQPETSTIPAGLGERLIMLSWMAGGAVFAPLLALPIMALLNRRRRPEMR